MKSKHFRLFLLLFLDHSTSKKFLIGVWLGLAFSISVILSTIGLMDGFEHALRLGLKSAAGDITMQSRYGFFQYNKTIISDLEKVLIKNASPIVQSESFLIFNDESRGVIVKGIDKNYGTTVDLPIKLSPKSVAIGDEIARIHNIKMGDEVVLAFGRGDRVYNNMPSLIRFRVDQLIHHGVYQKDTRMIYANLNEIQEILGLGQKVNMVAFNVERVKKISSQEELDLITKKIYYLNENFSSEFYFKPYWREFSSLIEAVQAEKSLITRVLQLIVLISVFNVIAFIYFINEKKSKELFLFKALGVSKKAISWLWIQFVLILWLASCLMSLLFVQLMRLLLAKLSFLKLPAEIYHMPRIDLVISWQDYFQVFALALAWILVITLLLLWNLKNKSLLEGLRQEFV